MRTLTNLSKFWVESFFLLHEFVHDFNFSDIFRKKFNNLCIRDS